MLEINMEFRKGILFIRLSGNLDKITVTKLHEEVTDIVKENGIRNIVFNVEQLRQIDMEGINALLYNYKLCQKNNGKSLLCGIQNEQVKNKISKSHILKYMNEIHDELSAFKMINV